jgi:membrane associated rhomboid family serine protease
VERFPRTATNVIAAVTALAWLAAVLFTRPGVVEYALGFIPLRLELPAAHLPGVPLAPAWLTPLTATLVHSGPLHLGFNLLILVWCGREVERVLGRTGLIALYLVGAYASALAQWAVDPMSNVPMVGASGAISAVMGTFALSFGRARRISNNFRLNRWINVVWLLAAWIVLQYMMGWLAGGQGYLLATPAHIGGFAAGLLLQRPLLLWRYRNA